MRASIIERIWGPNCIWQSWRGEIPYPNHQHIDLIRYQLSEMMLEGVLQNNTQMVQYATSNLDKYVSQNTPITDPTVRSMAYIAHALGLAFLPQYNEYVSDHGRKDFYFATVLEKSSRLSSLELFDNLMGMRKSFDFECIPTSSFPLVTLQSTFFKIAVALAARNEMQRIKDCTELHMWLTQHLHSTYQIAEYMMVETAKHGALETFAWVVAQVKTSKFFQEGNAVETIIRGTSNMCVQNGHMDVFDHLFNTFPQHQAYMFDINTKGCTVPKSLDQLLEYMPRLEPKDLAQIASHHTTDSLVHKVVTEHAHNVLQRHTISQCVSSNHVSQRRKV